MKTKLFLASATVLVALSLTGVASADTMRDQIEAEGDQQIQSYWNEYQQALQDKQNAWEQSQGDRWSQAYQDADAHAGAAYREWLEARTALGDRLHAYDVSQWEKEEQDDQPSNQTPVVDSQVPEENSQAPNTQGSQATVPTSQSATPASQAKLSSQPATQELTQQVSVADPASKSVAQAEQVAKPVPQKPQQADMSAQADKADNLPMQNEKPVHERTEQNSEATLPQTGNQAGLGAIGIGIASALAMFGLAGAKRD